MTTNTQSLCSPYESENHDVLREFVDNLARRSYFPGSASAMEQISRIFV